MSRVRPNQNVIQSVALSQAGCTEVAQIAQVARADDYVVHGEHTDG